MIVIMIVNGSISCVKKKKTNETLNNWKLNYEDDETIDQKRLQDSQAFYV